MEISKRQERLIYAGLAIVVVGAVTGFVFFIKSLQPKPADPPELDIETIFNSEGIFVYRAKGEFKGHYRLLVTHYKDGVRTVLHEYGRMSFESSNANEITLGGHAGLVDNKARIAHISTRISGPSGSWLQIEPVELTHYKPHHLEGIIALPGPSDSLPTKSEPAILVKFPGADENWYAIELLQADPP